MRSIASAAIACIAFAAAAAAPMREAAPFYTPEQFVHGFYTHWMLPRAREFATASQALVASTTSHCDSGSAEPPKTQWIAAMTAWIRLATIAVGPVLARKSLRTIDFEPARAQAIERAVAAAPAGAAAMESIGGPAKGFGALEWLLWTRPARPSTPECRYAIEVAADIAREASALQRAIDELAQRDWEPDDAAVAMSEIVNQWIGAIERLRWAAMDKPLRAAQGRKPAYPRSASGATREQWRAQWDAVAALASGDGALPAPGTSVVSIVAYLRGRGLNGIADALAASVRAADARMHAVDPAHSNTVIAATTVLQPLKRTAEGRVAPALKIRIGFSDADGD